MKNNNFKETLKKLIFYNIQWKILSLIFAIFSWFVVMNLINPTEIKSYSVNLTLNNKDKLEANDFAILNEDELKKVKIEVKVKGTRAALDELNKKENRENIKAIVDLSQFELLYAQDVEEIVKIGVTPRLPANLNANLYQIVSYDPTFVEIKLDNVSRKTMPVTVQVVGSVADGYIYSKPTVEPNEITVIGAVSELNNLAEVRLDVDLSGATESIESDAVPMAVDANGKILPKLKFELDKVKVKISVNKQGQIVVAQPMVTGEPEEGFSVDKVEFEPKFIEVIGNAEGISSVPIIELPDVSVEGINEDKKVVFDIRPYLKNTGLTLKNYNKNEIYVNVKLKKDEVYPITVPKDKINIKGLKEGLSAVINSELIIEAYDAQYDISELMAELDLSDIDIGSHSVEVVLNKTDGIKKDAKYYLEVEIMPEAEESTSEVTTQQEPEEAAATTEDTIQSSTE